MFFAPCYHQLLCIKPSKRKTNQHKVFTFGFHLLFTPSQLSDTQGECESCESLQFAFFSMCLFASCHILLKIFNSCLAVFGWLFLKTEQFGTVMLTLSSFTSCHDQHFLYFLVLIYFFYAFGLSVPHTCTFIANLETCSSGHAFFPVILYSHLTEICVFSTEKMDNNSISNPG